MRHETAKFIFRWVLSTGYVQGTIPPRFDDANRRPITACGSDSKKYIDGRWSQNRIHQEAQNWIEKSGGIGYSVGYLECHDPNDKIAQAIIPLTLLKQKGVTLATCYT